MTALHDNTMEVRPKVTIIIPVYNVAPYLRECLDCAINQTLKDIEIICVNDGSTDGSALILEEYATRDNRILIVTQENKGLSGARNSGLVIAKGEYLYFFDSDDRMELNAMESLYGQAHMNQLDIVLFDAASFYDDEKLKDAYPQYKSLYKRKKEYGQIVAGSELFVHMKRDNAYVCSACCYFFRSGFLARHQLHFYEGILHEDELFAFQTLLLAERAKHVKQTYFYRRIRENSIMTKSKSMKNVKGYAVSVLNMLLTIQKLSLSEDIMDAAIQHIAIFMKRVYSSYNQLPDAQKLANMLSGDEIIIAKLLNALQSTNKKQATEENEESIIIPSRKDRVAMQKDSVSDEPLVSIIVLGNEDKSSHNECLESLIDQTLHNLEIIYVMFGISDHSRSNLFEYAKRDSRIHITNECCIDYVNAIQVGIKNSKGKYIGVVNSTDYVEKDIYEILCSIADANQIDIVKTDIIEFHDEGGNRVQRQLPLLSKTELYNHVIYPNTENEIFLANIPLVGGIYNKQFLTFICSLISTDMWKSSYVDTILMIQSFYHANKACFIRKAFYMLKCQSNFSISNDHEHKAAEIFEEYKTLYSLFFQSPENKAFFMPIYQKKRHQDYMQAYLQIDPAFQLQFLRNYCSELKESLQKNELDLSLFQKTEKENVHEILNSPEKYYFSHCSGTFSEKVSMEINNKQERLKQVQNEIIAWQTNKNRENQCGHVKISIIIPVYNAQEYLEECLQSILRQTLRDIEIICVDDGSADKSPNILSFFAQMDDRVTIYSQSNSGSAKARNKGLTMATGEFVAFMDADDWYPTDDVLQVLYDAARENGAKICGGGRILQETSFQLAPNNFTEDKLLLFEDYQFDWGYQSYIFDLTMLRENKINFPDYLRYQDPPFFLRAMITAKQFFALRKVCYCYRRGHQSINWTERKICDLLKGLLDELEIAKQYGLNKLFSMVIQRIDKNYADIFVKGCTDGSTEVLRLLYKANDVINEASLYPEAFPTFTQVTLSPIQRVLGALSEKNVTSNLPQETKKLQKKLKEVTNELTATRHSFSYRLGRLLTFPLRKIRSFLQISRREGIKVAMKRIIRKFGQLPQIMKKF